MAWAYLAIAIATEIVGILGMRRVAGTPEWWGIAAVVVAYALSFIFMILALRTLNVGAVYAIWSGVGTAAVCIGGVVIFGDRLNLVALLGVAIIVLGVVVVVGSGSARQV